MKNFDEALADFDKSIQIGPSRWGYVQRGQVLCDMGRHAEAAPDYHNARIYAEKEGVENVDEWDALVSLRNALIENKVKLD